MSKTINIGNKSYPRGLPTAGLTRRQFSVISEFSTIQGTPKAIRDWLISSAADSPVRIFHAPGKVQGYMGENPGFGLKWPIPFASFDPDTFLLKTAQRSLFEDSDQSLVRFTRWGIMLDGALYRQATSVQNISVKGCGLWRTPDTGKGSPSRLLAKGVRTRKSGHKITIRLEDQVHNPKLWPTCTVSGNYNRKGVSKTSLFPTPTRNDSKNNGQVSQMHRNSIALNCIVKKFPAPTSEQARWNSQTRPKYSKIPKGWLNPDWVEWLMGWPIGWSSLVPLKKLRWKPIGTEPNISRLTTVKKHRASRIAALGDGQVPLCAAVAWRWCVDSNPF